MNKKFKITNKLTFIFILPYVLNNLSINYIFDYKDIRSLFCSCKLNNNKKLIYKIQLNSINEEIMKSINTFININLININCEIEYSYLFLINNLKKLKRLNIYNKLINLFNLKIVDLLFLNNHPIIEYLIIEESFCITNINHKLNCPNLLCLKINDRVNNQINFKNNFENLRLLTLNGNLNNCDLDFTHCTNLNELDLDDCMIYDFDIIKGLDCLDNLTTLFLRTNYLETIDELDKIHNLTHLDLSENYITNINPLQNLDIKILNLSENYIYNLNPIESLVNLLTLDMSYCNIDNIDVIKKCTKLTIINFSNNNIEDISVINYLMDLEEITFSSNKIKDLNSIKKKNFNILKEFDLELNNLSSDSIKIIHDLDKSFSNLNILI